MGYDVHYLDAIPCCAATAKACASLYKSKFPEYFTKVSVEPHMVDYKYEPINGTYEITYDADCEDHLI
jgi:hypothetical protein